MIASGAPAEFGRTAGGVVNVITKSGTNAHARQPVPLPAAGRADRRPLGRHHARGLPPRAVRRHDRRADQEGQGVLLLRARGHHRQLPAAEPEPASSATCRARCRIRRSSANEALINSNADCQRTALLGFFQHAVRPGRRRPDRASDRDRGAARQGRRRPPTPATTISGSWNFNHSRKENETFDVATYGTSANGIEGDPARINVVNLNWFTTLSSTNAERGALHLLARDPAAHRRRFRHPCGRHRHGLRAVVPLRQSVLPAAERRRADLARRRSRNNVSIVTGTHTFKVGGEWMHTLNDQVFRGFFTGRYLFDSVTGLPALRVAGGGGRVRAGHGRLLDGGVRDLTSRPRRRARRATTDGGPLLLYLQGAGRSGPATDAAGASSDHQRRVLAVRAGLVAGPAEPHAQLRPALGRAADAGDGRSADDRVRARSSTIPRSRPTARSRASGTCGSRALGVAWDVKGNGKSLVRASCGRLLRAAEHAEPGRLGDDQRPAAADASS